MTDRLAQMLHDSLEREARRFDAEHAGDDTLLYERAIVPRRRARRAAAALGGLAAAAAVAFGGYAILPADGPAPPAGPPATASAPTEPITERTWTPPGELRPDGAVADLRSYWGLVSGTVPGCVELDRAARLAGHESLGGDEVRLGTIADGSGGTHLITARALDSAEDAASYLDAVARAALACEGDAAQAGLEVAVAEVGIQQIAGEGIRVDVVPDQPVGGRSWSTWIHVQGSEALAVTSAGATAPLAPEVAIAWFTARSG